MFKQRTRRVGPSESAGDCIAAATMPTAPHVKPILGDETVDRGHWQNPVDFILSLVCYAVGLGDVWRFPYLSYKNGGGAFLVVYLIFFLLAGLPLFAMEVTIGQYLQRGAMEIWAICPILKGVGLASLVLTAMCIVYFCVLMSWAAFYLVCSMQATLPWETCNNWCWRCVSGLATFSGSLYNGSLNGTSQTSVEQFWERRVLMLTPTLSDFGAVQWELFGLLAVCWVMVYFALWKGLTKARYFIYVCSIFPYVILLVVLIRGLTLPGAMSGVVYFIVPNVTKLTEASVWKDAGTQVFYTSGVGYGILTALGSHNKFTHNCYRDAYIMTTVDTITSIVAGFAVFSILGYMSLATGRDISDVVKSANIVHHLCVGLAFLTYPEVATHLPLKQLWSAAFFLMIVIIGLDCQVCMVEGLVVSFEDRFPVLRTHKKTTLLAVCLFFFTTGVPLVTYSGSHWLTLVDAYGGSGIALLFVVFFEAVGIAWCFGAKRLATALEEMLGFRPSAIMHFLWAYAAPLSTAVLFFFCVAMYEPLKYPSGESYPHTGLILSAASMIMIPAYALYYVVFRERTTSFRQRVVQGFTASPLMDASQPTCSKSLPN